MLARLGRPLVGAGEVTDEDFGEIYPDVDAVGLEVVEPGPCRALEHERDILYGNALVAVRYADGGGVVNKPIFRLHGAVVFRRTPTFPIVRLGCKGSTSAIVTTG